MESKHKINLESNVLKKNNLPAQTTCQLNSGGYINAILQFTVQVGGKKSTCENTELFKIFIQLKWCEEYVHEQIREGRLSHII